MRRSMPWALVLLLFGYAAAAQGPVRLDAVNYSLPKSLTGAPGNAAAGKEVFISHKLGNCVACRAVTSLKSGEFHGQFGPSLYGDI